jgi:hypothetical protein
MKIKHVQQMKHSIKKVVLNVHVIQQPVKKSVMFNVQLHPQFVQI